MRFRFKIWIEAEDGKPLIGKGGVKLLRAIEETGSLSSASKSLGVSYKFAWEYVKRINEILSDSVEMRKGGKNAGGSKVNEKLDKLLNIYEEAQKEISEILEKYNKKINEVLNQEGEKA
ncbi:LysR family transcriptional regulator [Saccharolobus solfataricus]|uniref:Molybdenum transport protein ModA related protein (ModA) n=3 Tax=Saccharolobus solfataricus TaxID=2287 RepID=Q97Z66_SACS2|nr:winged helix-turn-helix domain-containing protein [Saccharolobus solfataricus]AAK41329.1 Molybdenum transport protein ModA related protein (modA) [Saccharolobus solfataricus P2]AKA74273.1 LysR family transcriptional regulator [Saccharolobus solfataricus]AKA76970.1 LysR family transcriptional regulator [Saccharolobus solfataricus]AKA79662.1 LysR family transcriptional regulator [Saccharolobus solfataricus]AZF68755.1 LysR family transcriptional regulator [Saccharolobus solfataricus]